MRKLWRVLIALLLLPGATHLDAERRIAVIVDTSGSMGWNDHARFAVQVSKILSDLVEDQDQIAIIRFPLPNRGGGAPPPQNFADLFKALMQREAAGVQNCSVGADPSLMVQLQGAQRDTFKQRIDRLLQYDGPTYFGAPLRTALSFLGENRSTQRLLLLVSDAEEGFSECKDQYTQILQRLGASGTQVALIKIGGYANDGFANNSAIQFRENVRDSANLIGAVAQVYQRFLGSKKVQTGPVSGDITVAIDPHVKDAYLVVAADSALGSIEQKAGNPAADRVDLDYRGGGQTRAVGRYQAENGQQGMDTAMRGYRIVHLMNPAAGSYTFSPPPGTQGGWMLLQDYSIELRMITRDVPSNTIAPVKVEVVDRRTGMRIADPATLRDLRVDGKIESSIVSLTPDGSGVFTVDHHFGEGGEAPLQLRLRGGSIDKSYSLSVPIARNAAPPSAANTAPAPTSSPAPISPPPPPPPPPPELMAKEHDVEYGQTNLLRLGTLRSGGDGQATIQFTDAHIASDVDMQITTDFEKRHAQLELQTRDGWRPLSSTPLHVRVPAGDTMQWPVRIHLGECPAVCALAEDHKISFVVHRLGGGEQRADVPLKLQIVPDPWWICWRREILALFLLAIGGILVHGFVSPYRFAQRAGVQMSPVEDLNEGYFLPLRGNPGSGAGFYRNATLYLTEDLRLVSHRRGGFVRLRAYRNRIRLHPQNGRMVWRQQADGSWEPLNPGQEVAALPGVIYRNDAQTIFFELRSR